jgi:hypothetical protein
MDLQLIWLTAVDAPWRAYPAAALALVGLALTARGLWFGAAGRPGLLRQGRDAYAWIRGFQFAVAGLMLVAVAAAWTWRLPWLLVVALGILGEEMFETSRILTALNRHPRRPSSRDRAGERSWPSPAVTA